MGLADPAALERDAAAIEAEATTLRDAARPYGKAAKEMMWRGVAATAFQTQAQADVKQVNSLADRLVTLATEIRKGAKTVRAEIARREREAREAREAAERRAEQQRERWGPR
ncbi:MAG TPA: hypothetical protein VH257_08710 [Chloroflexota bacterium]|nr:hypothetical protein [Chloroflexota bacterium]